MSCFGCSSKQILHGIDTAVQVVSALNILTPEASGAQGNTDRQLLEMIYNIQKYDKSAQMFILASVKARLSKNVVVERTGNPNLSDRESATCPPSQ